MSTTPQDTTRTFAQRWRDFWFRPTDPTLLGFMRIMTGLLVIYIHLVYSLDLQSFFGEHGWYSTDRVERERKEFPWVVAPFWDWDESGLSARLPDFPHRRQAVVGFLRDLPADKAERESSLRYLNRIASIPNNQTARAALQYVLVMGTSEMVMNAHLGALIDESKRSPFDVGTTPEPFLAAPPEERAKIADEIRAFWKALPKDRGLTPDREYVLGHLIEMEQPARRAFVEFLNTLPEDGPKRRELIDYLDYWNNDSRNIYRRGNATFSVWFHVTDPTQMAVIHAGAIVVMALFTLGVFTRVTSVLTWLVAVGYIHRTQQVLFGMDTMMNILLIYLMIGNSGAALSVDRLIARYRAVRASLRRGGTIDPATRAFLAAPPPSAGAGFAVRMVQVHFCFIYMAAGLSKLKGPGWWNGNAFWDVMANPEFTLMRYPWYEDMVRAYSSIKPLYYFTNTFGVWFTLFLEIGFPFLVWTRMRPFMVWLAVLLHAGIGVLMGLNLFELLMMIMLLAFIPSSVIRDRLRGGPDLKKLGLGYDPAGEKDARTVAAVIAADVDGQVTPEARKAESPAVVAEGATVTGPAAVTALFGNVRLLRAVRWVLLVPGVRGLLARVLFPSPAAKTPPAPTAGPPSPAAAS